MRLEGLYCLFCSIGLVCMGRNKSERDYAFVLADLRAYETSLSRTHVLGETPVLCNLSFIFCHALIIVAAWQFSAVNPK